MRRLIVIGASLGGLRACSALFGALAAHFTVPIVLVQHRQPDGGLLLKALRAVSVLPVSEIEDKQPLTAPGIYLAPADYHTLVEDDHCALSVDERVLAARPSIDVLFESAADACGSRLAGVLLTGASADGARGMRSIRQAGGITIVQDPRSAECATMPEAALAATAVDFVAPLAGIAAILNRFGASQEDHTYGA